MSDTKAVIFSDGKFQSIGNDGLAVPYGKLYFYDAFSGDRVNTYTTSTMETANTWPIVLTASGKGDVYVTDGQFNVTLQDKNGATVWTINNYIPAGGTTPLTPTAVSPTKEEFVDEVGSSIILDGTPLTTVDIHKNGLLLNTDEYTLDGRTITFVTPLIVTDEIVVEFSRIIADGANQGILYTVSTITDLLALDISYLNSNVSGYAADNDGGEGIFNYDSTIDKSTANGGTIFDPDQTLPNQGSGVGTGCWVRQYSGAINIKWFNADSTGTSDVATILQSIIDDAPAKGVTIFFPKGTYRLESEITISTSGIRFVGTGKNTVYPGVFSISSEVVSTLMPVHTDRNLLRFSNATINIAGSFKAENINFATLETGDVPTAAIGFDAGENFHRDYIFDRCGIYGFTAAFDMYNEGGVAQVLQFAALSVYDCCINRNVWIARNLNTTQWNGCIFERNEAGQNGGGGTGGGFDLRGQSVKILNNLLEGQANTIQITGNYKGIVIKGNYFEQNSGDYVIRLSSTIGAEVGPNYHNTTLADEIVDLFGCVDTIVGETINVHQNGCFNTKMLTNEVSIPTKIVANNGTTTMFPFSEISERKQVNVGSAALFSTIVAVQNIFNGIQDSGGALITTSGTGIYSRTASSKTYAEGDIICAVSLVSYDSEPVLPPRLLLSLNSSVDGSTEGVLYNTDKSGVKLKNKTFLLMSLVRATAANTASITASLYPYGLSPAAGLTATYTTFIYNLGQDLEGVEPFVSHSMYKLATAAPLAGQWYTGDKLRLATPVAGGTEGFICTTSGIPGTWKTYGVIQA